MGSDPWTGAFGKGRGGRLHRERPRGDWVTLLPRKEPPGAGGKPGPSSQRLWRTTALNFSPKAHR